MTTTTDYKEYQTRSNTPGGKHPGCNYFSTLEKAYKAWEEDGNILKISWGYGINGKKHYLFRPKLKPKDEKDEERWSPESEEKMCSLSEKYKKAKPGELFWVWQLPILPKVGRWFAFKLELELSDEEFDKLVLPRRVVEILTVEEFKDKYFMGNI